MYVVLVYDISQNNNGQRRWSHVFKTIVPYCFFRVPVLQRRWSHVFKTCKKYLTHIQNSVFEGEISKVQLVKLQQELKPYIDKGEDSVIIFKSRQEKWLDKEFWGKDEDKTSFFL